MYSFPNFEPVHCSMSSSNCCFLTCIQISQETGKVVWYSHLCNNFPQFVVIHTIKAFTIVSEAEVDVFFWNFLASSMIQWMLAIWSLVLLPFLNPACTSASSQFMYCWSQAWRITWNLTLLVCEMRATVVVWAFFGIAVFGVIGMKTPFPVLWPLLRYPNLLAYWVQHFHSIIF